ncbi:hypothetical protein [Rhizobium sp. 768_B6_N1_8]|uniref:hypothetical protein n=1 Tax=unclassified Rhizobium TaxID=2613769 RepID=UPI003F22E6FF
MKIFWLVIVSIVIIIVPVLAVFQPVGIDWPGRWCAAGEIPGRCLRDWLASYSGWAAAVGALAAALMTLDPLREQVREARRQSDFLVGDAQPEFVLLRNRKTKRVTLQANNWNRRTVMIEEVTCLHPQDAKVFKFAERIKRQSWEEVAAPKPWENYRMKGWIDRTEPAPSRTFNVVLERGGKVDQSIAANGDKITVRVRYRVVGQIHERTSAVATALEITDESDEEP